MAILCDLSEIIDIRLRLNIEFRQCRITPYSQQKKMRQSRTFRTQHTYRNVKSLRANYKVNPSVTEEFSIYCQDKNNIWSTVHEHTYAVHTDALFLLRPAIFRSCESISAR